MRNNKRFWEFKAANKEKNAALMIYGDISNESWWGDEVTPKQFKQELDGVSGDIDIYINSGGGDVFAGNTIYNMLKRHEGKKTVHIDGIAASIASIIAMAGDEIIMPENAMMMIHNAWSYVCGDKQKMRRLADEMEKIDGMLAGVYAARGTKTAEEYAVLMDEETWFTAEEALENGLIDRIDEQKIVASMNGDFLCANGEQFDLNRYVHAEYPRKMTCAEKTEDHSNGDESQPVDDNKPQEALREQCRQFNDARKKIVERMIEE